MNLPGRSRTLDNSMWDRGLSAVDGRSNGIKLRSYAIRKGNGGKPVESYGDTRDVT